MNDTVIPFVKERESGSSPTTAAVSDSSRLPVYSEKTLTPPTERSCWCGGSLAPSLHPLYGKCTSCGTFVLRRTPTKEDLQQYYSLQGYWYEHQRRDCGFPDIERRAAADLNDRIPVWYDLLARSKPAIRSLLEIGCAHGGFLNYCRERGVLEVVGVEVDEETCRFARTHFNLPHVYPGLFPAVQLPQSRFDAVTGFDVIEHFLDPVAGLKSVADTLENNGIFFFQTPCYRGESESWAQFKPDEHIFLYDAHNIRLLCDQAGLEVLETRPGYFPEDMFVVGRRKTASKTRIAERKLADSRFAASEQFYLPAAERILFVRTDSIGDAVLASSMLEPLRRRFPQAKLAILCQQHIAELFVACPFVDSIICYDRKKMDHQAERTQILSEIAAFKPDVILNSVHSRDRLSNELAQSYRPACRVAVEGNLDNISLADHQRSLAGYEHIISLSEASCPELVRHADFLRGIGIGTKSLQPAVWTTAMDEALAETYFQQKNLDPQRTLALFPFTQHGIKDYPHFAEVLKSFADWNILILGGQDVREQCEQLTKQLRGNILNLAGRTTLREMAAMIRRCRLFIGSDSCGAHIACAVGTQNVVIVGGGHFGRFMPYNPLTTAVAFPLTCFSCNWHCKHNYAHCVLSLNPAVLAEAISGTLKSSSAKPRVFVQVDADNLPQTQQPLIGLIALDALEIIPVKTERPRENALASVQYGHGVHKEEPGFRWLDTDAKLHVSVPPDGLPCAITFQLQASQLEHYGDRPVRTNIQVNGEPEREIIFEADDQSKQVELNFCPSAEPYLIHLHTNQFFTDHDDDRRLTVRLQKLSLIQKTDGRGANYVVKNNSHANGSGGSSHPGANGSSNDRNDSAKPQLARTNGRHNGIHANGHAGEYLREANSHIARGDLKSCCASLKRAAQVAPDDVEVLGMFGNICFQLGDFQEARTQFRRVIQFEPKHPLFHVQLATTCQRLGDIEGLRTAVGRALALDPEYEPAHVLLASIHLQARHYAEAEFHYEQLLRRDPNRVEWLLPLGKCHFKLGNLQGSRELYKRVLKLEPGNNIAREAMKVICDSQSASTNGHASNPGQTRNTSVNGKSVQAPVTPVPVPALKNPDVILHQAVQLCTQAGQPDYGKHKKFYPAFEQALDVWITPRLGFSIKPNPFGQIFPLLAQRFESHRNAMRQHATEVLPFIQSPKLASIPRDKMDEVTPYWSNDYFHPGDARLAYAMVARYRPQRIIECGCGNSTKFLRQAATDYQTGTKIFCIDPEPRANIRGVADQFQQASTTTVDPMFFDQLEAGDFLFIDGSHLVMNGSDCVHLFLNVLPRLRHGVWVHFHDIFLPHDYPYELHINCRYNEQYMLAQLFLYSQEWLPALPIYYAHKQGILPHGGGSFWMRRLNPLPV